MSTRQLILNLAARKRAKVSRANLKHNNNTKNNNRLPAGTQERMLSQSAHASPPYSDGSGSRRSTPLLPPHAIDRLSESSLHGPEPIRPRHTLPSIFDLRPAKLRAFHTKLLPSAATSHLARHPRDQITPPQPKAFFLMYTIAFSNHFNLAKR